MSIFGHLICINNLDVKYNINIDSLSEIKYRNYQHIYSIKIESVQFDCVNIDSDQVNISKREDYVEILIHDTEENNIPKNIQTLHLTKYDDIGYESIDLKINNSEIFYDIINKTYLIRGELEKNERNYTKYNQ